jgi:DNA-binding response OmpR family regulator
MEPKKLHRIMLVEDEPDIRAVCELALETDPQLDVRVYPDAKSAHADFDAFDPDLVLLDVMMPGEDGPTMMERMREEGRLEDTSVVFLTAKAQPDEVRLYLEMGAIGVIEKPFDPLSLSERIRKIWSQQYG